MKCLFLLLVVFFCGTVFGLQDLTAPNPIYMGELDEEAIRVQHHFLKGEELEGGKEHEYEGTHFDEKSGTVHYQKGKFTLHPRAVVLDGKSHLVSIKCTAKGHLRLVSTKKAFAEGLKQGALLYFGAGYQSGCYKLHSNGQKGVNFFLVTEILSVKEKKEGYVIKATVEAEDPKQLIKDATFVVHRGQATQTPKYVEEEEEDEDLEVEGELMSARQLIKRSLPENVHVKLNHMSQAAERKMVMRYFHKRGLKSWWEKFKNEVTGEVKQTLQQAFHLGEKAIAALQTGTQAMQDAWNLLKKKVTDGINQELSMKQDNVVEWKVEHKADYGPFTAKASFSIKPTATVKWSILKWELQYFEIALSAVPTAKVELDYRVSKEVTLIKKELFPAISLGVPIIIPLGPIPGVAITLKASFSLDFEAKAEFTISGQLFAATASGELGYKAHWSKTIPVGSTSKWKTEPVTGFKWSMAGPTMETFEAKLTATLTPKISIGVGINLGYVLSITGGPVLGLPFVLTLGFKEKECALALEWDFRFSIELGLQIEALGYSLLKMESKELKSWSIKDWILKALGKTSDEAHPQEGIDYWCIVKGKALVKAVEKAKEAPAQISGGSSPKGAKKP